MKVFCECAQKTPSELIQESIAELKQGLLPVERKNTTYIAIYKKYMSDKGYAPKSFNLGIAAVRSFYKSYDIPLSASIGKMKARKALPLRENQIFLAKDDIKKMIANAKNLREKAIILCMATSGMARNEIINLKIQDITIDDSGVSIVSVRREKSQVDYHTFVSPEAVQALRTYWDERNRNPKTAIKSSEDYVFVTYNNGNQVNGRTFVELFNLLGKQLGYQNGNGYIKSRSHQLRKFFASTLENAGMPKNKIDFMLGHTPSGNDLAYFRTDVEALKKLYIKYLPYLAFEKAIEVRSLDTEDAKKLDELERALQNKEQQLLKANQDILDTKLKLETIERYFAELQQAVHTKDKAHGFYTGIPNIDMQDFKGQERLIKDLESRGMHAEARALRPRKAKKN